MKIYYKSGFKYQLVNPLTIATKIKIPFYINTRYITMGTNGTLHISAGFAWDGASGITIDTESSMRASAVHDALYKLIRMGRLFEVKVREQADEEFYRLCLEDGMWKWRARVWFRALRIGGGPAASPDNLKVIYEAGRED